MSSSKKGAAAAAAAAAAAGAEAAGNIRQTRRGKHQMHNTYPPVHRRRPLSQSQSQKRRRQTQPTTLINPN
jgi:hypothetical protein